MVIDLYTYRDLFRGTRHQHHGAVFRKTPTYMIEKHLDVLKKCVQISYSAFLVESRNIGGSAYGPVKQLAIMYELDEDVILDILVEDKDYALILGEEYAVTVIG